ncbi:MAG: alanyl-tRNA editing protein [Acidobacteriota bacterium]|nr:alanyl-tRNA editing protein [Acidobacteriota bacterium]
MIQAFEREPNLRQLEVDVILVAEDKGGPYALLNDTVLYPEGGGQPADHGYLGAIRVHDVQRINGEIRHYLERPTKRGLHKLTLDWERRFDHMQQHTAQHLITAIGSSTFGWETTSFHLGTKSSNIELDVASIAETDLESLEGQTAAVIREARAVTAYRVPAEDLTTKSIRSRGLPAGHTGDIRLVEISGIDCNTCGGTHVQTTSEIETIKLLGTDRMRGGTRLYWVAGTRVRGLLASHEIRAATLREIFESSDDEVIQVAETKLLRLKEAEHRIKQLNIDLAKETALRLESTQGTVVEAHIDSADAGFLQSVARQMTSHGTSRPGLLTSTNDSGKFFLLYHAGNSDIDLVTIGNHVATLLEGRGGGSPRLFQGKAGSLQRRKEAISILENAISARSR